MRIALVSPVFHSYYRSIEFGLEQLGHDVSCIPYDARVGIRGKLAGKLIEDVPDQLGWDVQRQRVARTTTRVRDAMASGKFDVLLVVKGDVLDPEFVSDVRRAGTRTVLYLYDEIRRTRHTMESISAYDTVAAYSRQDFGQLEALGHDVRYVPGAFDIRMKPGSMPVRTDPDLVFIGARYGRREEFLNFAQESGLSVRAYGRDWSRHPVDRTRALSWRRPGIPASRDVPLTESGSVLAGAAAALNVHFNQDGLTMRTYEIPGMGGLQVIDRTDVHEAYEPGREILTFSSPEELVELVRAAKRDPAWAAKIRTAGRKRTLDEHTFQRRCAELIR